MTNDNVSEQLYAWLSEAVELRFGEANDPEGALILPSQQDGPGAFVGVLLRARQRADRIEELLVKAKRVRRALYVKMQEASDAAEDKMDEALAEGAASRQEFSLGIERKAEASLKSFEEKRAQRAAQRRLDVADEVVDALKDIHFGLSGWRNDVRDIIRSFQLESNLER